MKKLTIIAMLLTAFTFSAKAQWFDFSQNYKDFTIGFNAGVVGYDFVGGQIDKNIASFGSGISFSLLGVYVDFIYQSPEHKWGNKIESKVYNDHTALTINAGYKIPVTNWLNITPLLGYSNETYGETDCSTANVDYESRSIYHPYTVNERYSHFNYGLGLSFKPTKWIELGGVCTAHAIYGNLSLNLLGMADY